MQPLLAAFAAWLIKESPFWVAHTGVELYFMFNYTEIELNVLQIAFLNY